MKALVLSLALLSTPALTPAEAAGHQPSRSLSPFANVRDPNRTTVRGRFARWEHIDYGWMLSLNADDGRSFNLRLDSASLNFGANERKPMPSGPDFYGYVCEKGEYVLERVSQHEHRLVTALCYDR